MFDVHAEISGFSRIDFDKKKIRKALRIEGRAIQKISRALVSRRVISKAGEYPGKETGQLARSIQVKVSRSGFLARIAPYNKSNAMKVFYPALLYYGVKTHGRIKPLALGEGIGANNRRRRGQRKALIAERAANQNYKIAPRKNYMTDALDRRRESARSAILNALQGALIPR